MIIFVNLLFCETRCFNPFRSDFHIPQLLKSLSFYISEAWRRYPFRAECPRIGHCIFLTKNTYDLSFISFSFVSLRKIVYALQQWVNIDFEVKSNLVLALNLIRFWSVEVPQVPELTNVEYLPMMSVKKHQERLRESTESSPNSPYSKKMFRDQSGELVGGYWVRIDDLI